MPLDAILLTALRRELENSLLGAKIDRISMPEKDVLILSVHSREQGSRPHGKVLPQAQFRTGTVIPGTHGPDQFQVFIHHV